MERRFEECKLFVGGLPQKGVTPDCLRSHFARYGNVVHALVMVHPETGACRGFGFVEFDNEAAALRALDWREKDNHVFGGRKVEVKRAKARSMETQPACSNPNADSKKIFVGGLRDSVTKDDLTGYFERFGTITDVVVMYEKMTGNPRGFGFVTFDSQEATDKVLENRFHDLNGIRVETKHAKPREQCQYQNRGRIPALNYDGMYSPHNHIQYVPYGPYLVHPYHYVYAPYYMNQMAASGDTGMMTIQSSPVMHTGYGRSFEYDTVSPNYLGRHSHLGVDSKMSQVKGNQQEVGISAPSMKSDPVKSDPIKSADPIKSDPDPDTLENDNSL